MRFNTDKALLKTDHSHFLISRFLVVCALGTPIRRVQTAFTQHF